MCWQKVADDSTMHMTNIRKHAQLSLSGMRTIPMIDQISDTHSHRYIALQSLAKHYTCVPLRVVAELSRMCTATCGGRIVMHAYRYVWWQNYHACVPLRVVAELSCMRTATCGGGLLHDSEGDGTLERVRHLNILQVFRHNQRRRPVHFLVPMIPVPGIKHTVKSYTCPWD